MKVGTDGVLLGAWAGVESSERILDLGTGTGLIALMAAQRTPSACITAIDIDDAAALEATRNVKGSKFADRVRVLHASVQEHEPEEQYDHIICNPPYFEINDRTDGDSRTIARQQSELSLTELLAQSTRLLDEGGRLTVIIPRSALQDFTVQAKETGFQPTRIMEVLPTPTSPPKRALVELVLGGGGVPTKNALVIESDGRHHYSYDYTELTKDFYLNM